MNSKQFQESVISTFKKYFPNGYAHVSQYALGGGVHFSFGLISNLDDVSNKIRENDPLRIGFGIHEVVKFNSEEEINQKIVIEFGSSHLSTLPVVKYFAMHSLKIPTRKINNTPEKALLALDKYFQRAKETVQQQAQNNNIYDQQAISAKYL